MHKRTIQSILNRKTSALIDALKEKDVPQPVIEAIWNGIITGGSIASMLMDEEVNDYDLYLASAQDAHAVMEWAARRFNIKHKDKPDIEVRWAGPDGEKTEPFFYISDSGVASGDPEDPENPSEEMERGMFGYIKTSAKSDPYEPVFFSQNAIGLAPPHVAKFAKPAPSIQIITRFYGDAEAVHKAFDYVHCTNWYDIAKNKIHLRQEAIESLFCKTLVYTGSMFPVCSLLRMRKFIKRGWHINAGQVLRMSLQISQLDLYDQRVLREQLIGVDATYFAQLFHAIAEGKEGGSENIDEIYLARLIDEIFG